MTHLLYEKEVPLKIEYENIAYYKSLSDEQISIIRNNADKAFEEMCKTIEAYYKARLLDVDCPLDTLFTLAEKQFDLIKVLKYAGDYFIVNYYINDSFNNRHSSDFNSEVSVSYELKDNIISLYTVPVIRI